MTEPGNDRTALIKVETVNRDGVSIVAVAGEVDMATVELVSDELTWQLDRRPPVLVIDLGGVSFFGSAGIGALITARDRAERRGVPLALVAAMPVVLRPLECTATKDLFCIYPTLPAALREV